ncbi:MAG: hypothetical protein OEZ28_14150 [Nitrospinota bacterium]|nr:hypothetical protein [Nitrospinota bacterium]
MKRTNLSLFSLIAVCLPLIMLLGGCGKFIDRQATINVDRSKNDQGGGQNSTSCGPTQQMGTYVADWVYTDCPKQDWLHIHPGTVNDKGIALGQRNVGKGMLSVRYTQMDNATISDKENFGVFFMGKGHNGGEVNWQWMSYKKTHEDIQSRLIIQRFDGTCPGFCEHADITDELQFRSFSEIFQWDCQWDTTVNNISCVITKVGDPTVNIFTRLEPMGPYNTLTYIGLGQKAFEGPYESYRGVISDVKLTIFK